MKNIIKKLKIYARLMRLDKPIGMYLLFWPMCWAMLLASASVWSWRLFVVFTSGVVVTRSLGCVINDLADRNFDPFIARTKDRPLALGELSAIDAVKIAIVLVVMALTLLQQLPKETYFFGFLAAALIIIYPFCKRWIQWPQGVLGAAFAMSVPMVYEAVGHIVPLSAWVLWAAVLLWVTAYDTQYAMVDREDDAKLPIHSSALTLGSHARQGIAVLQMGFLVMMAGVGLLNHQSVFFYAGLLLAGGLFVVQWWQTQEGSPNRYFRAFLHNQWIGVAIGLGLLANKMLS